MKNLLKQFLDGEIGLDIRSDPSAVFDVSKMIETQFPNAIVPQSPWDGNPRLYSKTLNGYYNHCKKSGWKIIILEKETHWFNAFMRSNPRVKDFEIYKAEEIIRDDNAAEISEAEFMNLFKAE